MEFMGFSAIQLVVMISVFALVLAVWVMVVVVWNARVGARQEKIQRRLELIAQPQAGEGRILRLWSDGQEATTIVPGAGERGFIGRLDQMRRTAGIQTPVSVMLMFIVVGGLFAGLFGLMLTHSFIVGLCAAVTVFLAVWIWLKQRIAKRAVLFESQLVDALELAARSLKAGHPLPGAFRLVSEEIAPPIGTVFAEVCQQQDLGVGIDESLRKTAEASPSPDLKLFATSVVMQLRTGGNLVDMMERLALVIRDRMRLTRRVRVLTAQTQFSKRILLLLPFVVFVILNLLNPEYMRPLYTTGPGTRLLAVAAAALIIGAWLMNRLAIIRY